MTMGRWMIMEMMRIDKSPSSLWSIRHHVYYHRGFCSSSCSSQMKTKTKSNSVRSLTSSSSFSTLLNKQDNEEKKDNKIYSVALSVHFHQPELGMNQYEILSRASAFLLAVDPPPSDDDTADAASAAAAAAASAPYAHLKSSEIERQNRRLRQQYAGIPAGGPKRLAKTLGWLEFCPSNHRPLVHCIASSHVLSPWLWKQYYPQSWLSQVQSKHCSYSIELYDPKQNSRLAQFQLQPFPIHHPSGIDLAMIHLKDEEKALEQMKDLGLEPLYLRDYEQYPFEHSEEVLFDGFEVTEENMAGEEHLNLDHHGDNNKNQEENKDDTRIFLPYQQTGSLTYASATRFLAKTSAPLPEGLCGGPVLSTASTTTTNNNNNNTNNHPSNNNKNTVCGMIEGIVPINYTENKEMAGSAAFLPVNVLQGFIDYSEKLILRRIVPKILFDRVEQIKRGGPISGSSSSGTNESNAKDGVEFDLTEESGKQNKDKKNQNVDIEQTYEEVLQGLKKKYNPEQADAILSTIQRERTEVMEILRTEGGDLDDVIARVRAKTREKQREVMMEIQEALDRGELSSEDVVIVKKSDDDDENKDKEKEKDGGGKEQT